MKLLNRFIDFDMENPNKIPNNVPDSVQKYRMKFRERYGSLYSGKMHFCLTFGVGVSILIVSLWQLQDVALWEWFCVPLTFLYANFVEYTMHKGPMHKPVRFLKLIFKRHSLEHHQFFTDEAMEFETTRDYYAVLFPPLAIVFFFGGFAVPVGFLFYNFVSPNVCYLFVASSIGYFLNYEFFHWAYHSHPDSLIGRLPFMQTLRRLHLHHHNLSLMSRYNFNITYPIFDWLLGTHYQGEKIHFKDHNKSQRDTLIRDSD